jgi:hypothetical protein
LRQLRATVCCISQQMELQRHVKFLKKKSVKLLTQCYAFAINNA